MAGTPLHVALIAQNQVLAAPSLSADEPRRMARRFQVQAFRAGLTGSCRATLRAVPQRGLLGRAADFLELTLCDTNGGARGWLQREIPTARLEPLVQAAAVRAVAAGGLPSDTAVSYLVLQPDAPDGLVWASTLPAFVTNRCADMPPDCCELYPDVALPATDIPVLVRREALQACAAYCCDASGQCEKGAVLLGHICRAHGADPRLWLDVIGAAPAVGAEASALSIRFTAEAWQNIYETKAALEKELQLENTPLSYLGWCHGHPRDDDGRPRLWLSQADVSTQAMHFAEPYCLAAVVDQGSDAQAPLASRLAFFGWDYDGVGLTARSVCTTANEQAADLQQGDNQ